MTKSYETPEMVELGAAATLTLGNKGCANDGLDCKLNPTPVLDPAPEA